MRAGQQAGTNAVSPDAVPTAAAGRTIAYRSRRVRRQEVQTKNKRLAIVFSVFLALLAALLLVGGRVVIDPLLQQAATKREAYRIGEIVLTMPDGKFCRHLSFDNKSAELTEGVIKQCPSDHPANRAAAISGFSWGAR
jgi:hypothetical protein